MKKTLFLLLSSLFIHPLFSYNDCAQRNCFGKDMHISADFLYWTLQGDQLNYLFVSEGIYNDAISPDFLRSKESSYEINPDFFSGVRVAIEKFYGCPSINTFGRFCW